MEDPKKTCLNVDCPERTGGECNAPTHQSWETEFREKYTTLYFGKDADGFSVYIPQLAIDKIIEEIKVLISHTRSEAKEELAQELLSEIRQKKDYGHEANTILEGIEAELTFQSLKKP
jgi:hypothetical protein